MAESTLTGHPHDMIEVERRCFAETENPLHIWAAYALARASNAPVPDFVLRYFDLCGRSLLALSADANSTGGKDLGPKIAQAIKLEGKPGTGSPLVNYHGNWMVLGMNVRSRMQRRDANGRADKETHAIDAVAQQQRESASTVRRSFKLYDRLFPGDAIFPDETITSSKSVADSVKSSTSDP